MIEGGWREQSNDFILGSFPSQSKPESQSTQKTASMWDASHLSSPLHPKATSHQAGRSHLQHIGYFSNIEIDASTPRVESHSERQKLMTYRKHTCNFPATIKLNGVQLGEWNEATSKYFYMTSGGKFEEVLAYMNIHGVLVLRISA